MEENQVVYKCNTNHGLTSGILELYSDRLVYTSNKGAVTTYNYADITKAVSSMGCLEVKFTNGTSDAFSVDKELRLQMIDYINTKPVVQENKSTIQQTQNTNVLQEPAINFKDIPNDIKNFKNLNEDKKNMYIGLGSLLAIVVVVIMIINGIFGGSISSSGKQKSYVKEAVENLSSASTAPITSLNSAKIIKYGNDVLVAISYMQTNLYGSSSSYSSTYSTKQKRYLNNNELENMMIGEEWENAEIVQVDSDIIYELNKKFK